MFLCSQGQVIHAIRRVLQYLWTKKLNTFISAVLSVNLFSFVRESYTYKLQHLQFGAANCRLPTVPNFNLFRGLPVMRC